MRCFTRYRGKFEFETHPRKCRNFYIYIRLLYVLKKGRTKGGKKGRENSCGKCRAGKLGPPPIYTFTSSKSGKCQNQANVHFYLNPNKNTKWNKPAKGKITPRAPLSAEHFLAITLLLLENAFSRTK